MKKIVSLFIGLALGAAMLAGCSHNAEPFTQESYTADAAQIQEINMEVQDRFIEVSLSNDNQIHVAYYKNSEEFYDISVLDGHILTITSVNDKEWTDYIVGKTAAENRKISLQIPNALLTALTLSTTNEDISLPALTIAGDVSLSTNGGDIAFEKLNAEKSITLRSKNGNITGTVVGSYDDFAITCDSKKGKCNLPPKKENGAMTLQVHNNNGDVAIEFVNS